MISYVIVTISLLGLFTFRYPFLQQRLALAIFLVCGFTDIYLPGIRWCLEAIERGNTCKENTDTQAFIEIGQITF